MNTKPTNVRPVLTFGEALVVCIPSARGSLANVRAFHTDAAGAELNTAIGLARLQVPVSFAGSVGRDAFGQMIERQLRSEGVNVQHLHQIPQRQTGVFFKQTSGLQMDSQVFYYRSASPMACGEMDTDSLIEDLQRRAYSWLHMSGITWMIGQAAYPVCQAIVQTAKSVGVPVSFDVNLRFKLANLRAWQAMVKEVLPFTDWLLMGDTEADALYGTCDALLVEETVRREGFEGEGVIVKEGSNGATACVRGEPIHVDAVQVKEVVDTVGAGDGFNAGWIAGMCAEWDQRRALSLGAVVGAFAVSSPGDSSGYPMLEEAMDVLNGKGGPTR